MPGYSRASALQRLALDLRRYGADGLAAALYRALYDLAREARMAPRDASRVAVRGCKLAGMLLRPDRLEQRAAAHKLGVSERTAKADFQRLRRVVEDGGIAAAARELGISERLEPGDLERLMGV